MKMKFFFAALVLGLVSCGSEPSEAEVLKQEMDDQIEQLLESPDADGDEASSNTAEESPATGGDEIDAMLDDYEAFMDDYIELMKQAQAGDMSAMMESAEVMAEAQELGQSLSKIEGTMSMEQFERYANIAMKATSALGQ